MKMDFKISNIKEPLGHKWLLKKQGRDAFIVVIYQKA